MKKTFTVLLSLCSLLVQAQNWQCLQSGVKHYFINGNNYLRGIRIDSVKTWGDTIVYFPFQSARGSYDIILGPSTGSYSFTQFGSWLGSEVLQLSDGTFIFDNYWNAWWVNGDFWHNPVTIKTQSSIGDSWTLFRDSSTRYYKATVISTDTMTVLSAPDSVKSIMINAFDTSGHIASDLLDSFIIILSKNHGFIQVFDLYTFPYHKSDSAYRPGLDFYLDRSSCNAGEIRSRSGHPPAKNITLFHLINFINPSGQQLCSQRVGDVIVSGHAYGLNPYGGMGVTERLFDTVTGQAFSGHIRTDTITGSSGTCSTPYYSRPCHYIARAGVYHFADNDELLAYMPEDGNAPRSTYGYGPNFLFYYPDDTGYCLQNPAYIFISSFYSQAVGLSEQWTYKLGIGLTDYNYFDPEPQVERSGLASYKSGGIACPPIDSTTYVSNVPAQHNTYMIYPNPATNELTIKMSNTPNVTISLINMMGQTVKTVNSNKQEVTIAVDKIPAGIYTVMLTNGSGERINIKVVIQH